MATLNEMMALLSHIGRMNVKIYELEKIRDEFITRAKEGEEPTGNYEGVPLREDVFTIGDDKVKFCITDCGKSNRVATLICAPGMVGKLSLNDETVDPLPKTFEEAMEVAKAWVAIGRRP